MRHVEDRPVLRRIEERHALEPAAGLRVYSFIINLSSLDLYRYRLKLFVLIIAVSYRFLLFLHDSSVNQGFSSNPSGAPSRAVWSVGRAEGAQQREGRAGIDANGRIGSGHIGSDHIRSDHDRSDHIRSDHIRSDLITSQRADWAPPGAWRPIGRRTGQEAGAGRRGAGAPPLKCGHPCSTKCCAPRHPRRSTGSRSGRPAASAGRTGSDGNVSYQAVSDRIKCSTAPSKKYGR